jgi:hypothetical protein
MMLASSYLIYYVIWQIKFFDYNRFAIIYFVLITMGWIEWGNKESYELPKVEYRLDEFNNKNENGELNLKTVNWFKHDKNALYFLAIKSEPKKNEHWSQEWLEWIVEFKKVDGKIIASYLKPSKEWRMIDPLWIPDFLTELVKQKSKEIDTIPWNPEQSSKIDLSDEKEIWLWEIRNDLWMLEKEVRADIMVS